MKFRVHAITCGETQVHRHMLGEFLNEEEAFAAARSAVQAFAHISYVVDSTGLSRVFRRLTYEADFPDERVGKVAITGRLAANEPEEL